MKKFCRQTRSACVLAAVSLFALTAATGCGGGGSEEKQYTLAGRVVNGNPYQGTTEPRAGTKILVSRSSGTVVFPNGGTDERFVAFTETVADASGAFSLRVPAGLYYLTTLPPPGGNPNDGVITSDDVCASEEIIRFPPREGAPQGEGENVILGHDFCVLLPVTE